MSIFVTCKLWVPFDFMSPAPFRCPLDSFSADTAPLAPASPVADTGTDDDAARETGTLWGLGHEVGGADHALERTRQRERVGSVVNLEADRKRDRALQRDDII